MKLEEIIESVKCKCLLDDEELEVVIVKKDGTVICMDVMTQAKAITKVLKLFNKEK